MTTLEKIEAIKSEFGPFWEKALDINDYNERRALAAIRAAVDDMETMLHEAEIDRFVAQFDANWENIAANH